LRAAIAAAVEPFRCASIGGDVSEQRQVTISGFIGRDAEPRLRAAVQQTAGTAPVQWNIHTFNGPYCRALNIVRPIGPHFGEPASSVVVGLKGGAAALHDTSSNATQGFGGTNFGARGTGTNIIDGAVNPGSLDNGLNLGVVRGQVTLPGIGTVTNLAFLARALESDTKANILSTPNLLTLDNEEAKIVIGQNVPFITGQYAQTGAATTATPFQTIERRDVGLTLRIKPQISEGGSVRLQIYQEVSSVQDQTNPAGIITNKRSLESSVLVDDGQIIVIGGLIQDSTGNTLQKVPLLGDIPLLGALFRYETRTQTKTNLMVFLRPLVMKERSTYAPVTSERYRQMLEEQGKARIPPSIVLPDIITPMLPPEDGSPQIPEPNAPVQSAPEQSAPAQKPPAQ